MTIGSGMRLKGFVIICMLWMPLSAWAVTLQWTGVSYGEPVGYRLYYGPSSGHYDVVVDTGPAISASIGGLTVGQTYYFAATAYGTVNGLESAYSNEVSYLVPSDDITPPTVAIVSPTNGSTVQRKGSVTIEASASDDQGVTQVQMLVNGTLLCSRETPPYRCTWQVPTPPNRRYQLMASARDAASNVGNSPVVEVTAR
jgi:Bacterial Ig domain